MPASAPTRRAIRTAARAIGTTAPFAKGSEPATSSGPVDAQDARRVVADGLGAGLAQPGLHGRLPVAQRVRPQRQRRRAVGRGAQRPPPLLAVGVEPELGDPVGQRVAQRRVLRRVLGQRRVPVGPLPRDAPQHGVDEAGGAGADLAARQLDALGNRCMRRDSVSEQDLEDTQLQHVREASLQALHRAAGDVLEGRVERAPALDGAERQVHGEGTVARVDAAPARPRPRRRDRRRRPRRRRE